MGDRAADGRRPQLPVPDLRQPAHTVVAAPAGRESRSGHRDFDGTADPEVHRRARTARSWPTTPWSRPTNWAAAGSTSPRRRSASGHSSATRASPSPAGEVPDDGLVAVLSATPHKAKAGSSWLGSPPVRLRRKPTAADVLRTFHPSLRLKILRAHGGNVPADPGDGDVRDRCGCAVRAAVAGRRIRLGCGPRWPAAWCCWPPGAVAGGIAVIAKWLVVGRIRAIEHPLWSSFVWRNEVSDTFVETVAAPWFARAASGTPVMNLWLRALGAQDRSRRLVRDVLAARGRPRHPRGGRDRQPRLRGADPPVPRPDHADGHRCAGRGFDAGHALRRAARRTNRCGRHRRVRPRW